jgi:hypothetical protein
MKKISFFVTGSVVIISLLVSVLFINAKIEGDRLENSINNVKIYKGETGKNILKIDYGGNVFEKAKYRIKIMDKGEELLLPDRLLAEDGSSLGKYRIEIMFYDAQGSPALAKEYPLGSVHEISDVSVGLKSKYKIRTAYP